ncbi:MAG: hypothetical protein QMB13_00440 [Flavobacteriales bacterium]|jgi:hypothetical protein|tara:strand:+ start:21 stop:524 length:504 start_codon:yes stop_codon:yes gene_type:complete
MTTNQIHIEGNQLTISARKTPLFVRIVLTVFLVSLVLIPLAVTFFSLTYGDGPHIGIVFSFVLCWGVGFYLLRIVLWNSVGKEILTLNPETVTYVADYKLFKDGRKEISTSELVTEIIYEDEPNKPLGRLRLRSDLTSIETVLQTTIVELEELRKEIRTRYNTVYSK